jgi:uncharacterized protein YukE
MKLELDPSKVKGEVEQIRGFITEYTQMECALFDDGRGLDANWEGAAAEKFGTKMRNEEGNFKELARVCTSWCDAIDESCNEYQNTDRQTGDSVSSRV